MVLDRGADRREYFVLAGNDDCEKSVRRRKFMVVMISIMLDSEQILIPCNTVYITGLGENQNSKASVNGLGE